MLFIVLMVFRCLLVDGGSQLRYVAVAFYGLSGDCVTGFSGWVKKKYSKHGEMFIFATNFSDAGYTFNNRWIGIIDSRW